MVVLHFSHGWSSANLTLWLGLLMFPLTNNLLDHFSQDLLSHLVLPKDLLLSLGFPHEASDPGLRLLVFLSQHILVLCRLLPGQALVGDVLLVVLENSHNFLEVFLALLDFLHHPGD